MTRARPKDLGAVCKFLRTNTVFEEGQADYATSLILLTSSDVWTIGADLNATPELAQLPLLRRTGRFTPWMPGHQLGFLQDTITDADLQRARSLFLTVRAAAEDVIHLLGKVLDAWRSAGASPRPTWDDVVGVPSATSATLAACRPLFTALLEELTRAMSPSDGTAAALLAQLEQFLKAVETLSGCPLTDREKLLGWADKRIQDLLKDAPPPPSALLPADLLRNLLLSLRREGFEARHLGPERLNRLTGPDRQNVIIQGAGDLSMNAWNVAFRHTTRGPEVFLPESEPYTTRHYTCLVRWRDGVTVPRDVPAVGGRLSIATLRFFPGDPYVRLTDHAHATTRVDHLIDFAVYGKQILRDGRVVPRTEVVDEFLDLRHVFELPNLNPSAKEVREFLATERGKQFQTAHGDPFDSPAWNPRRYLYYQEQRTAVWFLEDVLLADRNIRHLACTLEGGDTPSMIAVELTHLGCPRVWADLCLQIKGYNSHPRVSAVRRAGDYAWDETDATRPVLHVRLKFNTYPCSIVAIGNRPDRPAEGGGWDTLYTLAWGHDFARGAHTIWDCAEVLRAVGARHALVMDEGQDVFQAYLADPTAAAEFGAAEAAGEGIDRWTPVPVTFDSTAAPLSLRRRSLRATLAFWHERVNSGPS